jgi:hypothetical protein
MIAPVYVASNTPRVTLGVPRSREDRDLATGARPFTTAQQAPHMTTGRVHHMPSRRLGFLQDRLDRLVLMARPRHTLSDPVTVGRTVQRPSQWPGHMRTSVVDSGLGHRPHPRRPTTKWVSPTEWCRSRPVRP